MFVAGVAVLRRNWFSLLALLLGMVALDLVYGHDNQWVAVAELIPYTAIVFYRTQRQVLSTMVPPRTFGEELRCFTVYFLNGVLLSVLVVFSAGAIRVQVAFHDPFVFLGKPVDTIILIIVAVAPMFLGFIVFGTWMPASIAGIETGFLAAGRRGLKCFLPVSLKCLAVVAISLAVSLAAEYGLERVITGLPYRLAILVKHDAFGLVQAVFLSTIFALAYMRSIIPGVYLARQIR